MNRTNLIPATIIAACVLHNICLKHLDKFENFQVVGFEYIRNRDDRDTLTAETDETTGRNDYTPIGPISMAVGEVPRDRLTRELCLGSE